MGRLRQLLAAVADVDAPQAGHAVQDPGAVGIPQPDAVGPGDDAAAALRRQALVIGEGRKMMGGVDPLPLGGGRSEEHTSELQSLMRISYAVFCLKKKN